ncbi:MAG TPA: Rrf2 family transcriptional regulator [Clostridiaceae bacterium]|nr:Rrf2 family transcriptional regulator [Clostridiaceae bacterium]
MKISTKGRYGLRSMVDLAVNSSGDQVPLCSIAERQNISENYLEQVFSALRKAGLVKSIKGAQGGYVLADHPSNIKVGTILRCLEGDLLVVDPDSVDDNSSEYTIQKCIKVNVWDKINESIEKVVDSLTLEDLVNDYKKMNDKYFPMYYI